LKNHKTVSQKITKADYCTTFTEVMVFFEVLDLSSVRFALHICFTYFFFCATIP